MVVGDWGHEEGTVEVGASGLYWLLLCPGWHKQGCSSGDGDPEVRASWPAEAVPRQVLV